MREKSGDYPDLNQCVFATEITKQTVERDEVKSWQDVKSDFGRSQP